MLPLKKLLIQENVKKSKETHFFLLLSSFNSEILDLREKFHEEKSCEIKFSTRQNYLESVKLFYLVAK